MSDWTVWSFCLVCVYALCRCEH